MPGIPAVAESADFGPAYAGENFVTITLRVPKDTRVPAGIYELNYLCPGGFDWAQEKSHAAALAES